MKIDTNLVESAGTNEPSSRGKQYFVRSSSFRHRSYLKGLLNQRGLSLVEVMIVIVVVGLLLGGSVIPLAAIWNSDIYDLEKQRMETFHDAIIGYAMTHKTEEREVEVIESSTNRRIFTLPASRAYLPCPDIDRDGFEDRENFDAIGLQMTLAFDITLTVSSTNNDLQVMGNCVATRGLLPWKTLGVFSHDSWGNHYTYEVDDIFSNAVFGFNENSVIDGFDSRDLVTLNSGNGNFYYSHREIEKEPIVICGRRDNIICQRALNASNMELDGGEIVTLSVGGLTPRGELLSGGVKRGIPYSIVSHGRNGYGAIKYMPVASNQLALGCNPPVNQSGSYAVPLELLDEAVNFPRVESIPSLSVIICSQPTYNGENLQDGHFVNAPRGQGEENYDDILIWMSTQELLDRLSRSDSFSDANDAPVLRAY